MLDVNVGSKEYERGAQERVSPSAQARCPVIRHKGRHLAVVPIRLVQFRSLVPTPLALLIGILARHGWCSPKC